MKQTSFIGCLAINIGL